MVQEVRLNPFYNIDRKAAAIWELNINNMEYKNKSAFDKYQYKPNTEKVEW